MRIPLALAQARHVRNLIFEFFESEEITFSSILKEFRFEINKGYIHFWRVGEEQKKSTLTKPLQDSGISSSLIVQNGMNRTVLSDYTVHTYYNQATPPHLQFQWRASDSDDCCRLIFVRIDLAKTFVNYYEDGAGWLARPKGKTNIRVPSTVPKYLKGKTEFLNFPFRWEFDFETRAKEILEESELIPFLKELY